MKFAYIGTYPPRQCGIGTFTQNLNESMTNSGNGSSSEHEGIIVALNDLETGYDYPNEVKYTIRQQHQRDYIQAAKYINYSGADVCILEHEYGIFGGESGVYILPLLHRLEIPLMVTLHTVLKTPSYTEKAIMQEISKMSSRLVVMSNKAIQFLTKVYQIPAGKLALLEHGVPDLNFDQAESKEQLNWENRKVLMTFGLLSRNKGIETVINALPRVVEKHPDTLYMILGKTHPNVVRYSGEEYRNYLRMLIKSLKLENHVFFLNEFVSQKDLFLYLSAADIYITPYMNEAQITSGTLAYAVGVGAAVISTPYWHAQELLADGRGRLFDFNDSAQLSNILMELMDQPDVLKTLRKNAYDYGQKITWPKIGKDYVNLAAEVVTEMPEKKIPEETIIDPLLLPLFSMVHIKRMTDDTGIIQHAKFGIPNLKEGYCLDDNARALLMVLMAYKQKKDRMALDLLPIYLSYIDYMQNPDGTFRNFLSFRRDYLDQVGSEDSFGRAVWALGYLLGNSPNDAYYQTGRMIFFDAVPNFEKLKSIRGIANTMIGLCYYLRTNKSDDSMTELLHKLSYKIIDQYDAEREEDWNWFEPILSYDNGILPLALLHAAEFIKDEKLLGTALDSMEFLAGITMHDGYLHLIGNEEWYRKGAEMSLYAQQPVDAMAMVLMFYQAFMITGNKAYLDNMFTSFMWFLGENDIRMNLYDFETEGCCDGIESFGINRNQGAESTLAYYISHLRVLRGYEQLHKS
ncbi:MAG: glycosyltransferase family 4 protein [Bacteroidales bacterium]|nr:glycosyltransferase family 4 protein [Bacteroidales bacterium]